jgi:hypothetical protein
MNPYEGPDGNDVRPDGDFDTDMIMMNSPRWQRWRAGRPIAVAGVAVVALAGGAGVGYAATHSLAAKPAAHNATVAAAAATPTPSPSAVPGKPGERGGPGWRAFAGGGMLPGPGRFLLGPIGGGILHGQFTTPKSGGGYQTVDVQNGTVTAVSANSVTVKSADGYTFTYTVTSKTVVGAQSAGIGSVKKGDTVFVTATVSGSTATAAGIIDVTAIKSGRASFGFPDHSEKLPALPAAPAQPPSA